MLTVDKPTNSSFNLVLVFIGSLHKNVPFGHEFNCPETSKTIAVSFDNVHFASSSLNKCIRQLITNNWVHRAYCRGDDWGGDNTRSAYVRHIKMCVGRSCAYYPRHRDICR